MRRLLSIVLGLALALPVLAGTLTDPAKLNQLKAGQTTAKQALQLLGKPAGGNRGPNGRFAYLYEVDLANKADPAKPHLRGVAALMFRKDGVFEGIQMLPPPKQAAKPASVPKKKK